MNEVTRLRLSLAASPGSETPVFAGLGALDAARSELAQWVAGRSLFVVASDRLRSLHGAALDPVRAAAARSVELTVPDGEAAKTLETAGRLWAEMIAAGGKRDSRLITLGGGSTGDLGGFVAASFLRGIAFTQVPTTLLAQVDASLGGKTGIDLPGAKNSVGAFHQPAFVIADSRFLATLPAAEVRAGLAEVIKMAFLLNPALFERLERELPQLLGGDPRALGPIVASAAAAKLAVVARDPFEAGERQLLNFGHTLGHALEAVLDFGGLSHGDAVAHGMRFVLPLAERRGLPAPEAERLRAMIRELAPAELPAGLEVEALMAAMARDKKVREGGWVWVLPRRLGEGASEPGISPQEVQAELEAFLRASRGGRA